MLNFVGSYTKENTNLIAFETILSHAGIIVNGLYSPGIFLGIRTLREIPAFQEPFNSDLESDSSLSNVMPSSVELSPAFVVDPFVLITSA